MVSPNSPDTRRVNPELLQAQPWQMLFQPDYG